MQYSKPDPSSPQPNLSVYEKGAKTTAAQMLTGEQVCQGHGFDETECLSIGCCQWDPSTPEGCWSAVQNGVCDPSRSCPDIAGTCVIIEHSAPYWKGSVTTVDQTGCKGFVVASNMHTNQPDQRLAGPTQHTLSIAMTSSSRHFFSRFRSVRDEHCSSTPTSLPAPSAPVSFHPADDDVCYFICKRLESSKGRRRI